MRGIAIAGSVLLGLYTALSVLFGLILLVPNTQCRLPGGASCGGVVPTLLGVLGPVVVGIAALVLTWARGTRPVVPFLGIAVSVALTWAALQVNS
ncbi:hypothetical protein [Actinosynnema sp. NPDC020468]|uniref:hypothetical protein n=1 Tax=Actinosynnema sp. NPDC020468 TaxID=3154488 RepID=UPI0033D1A9B3